MGLATPHAASVMFPWDFHETSVGLQSSHDTFVVFPWDVHRSFVGMSKFIPSVGGARHANMYICLCIRDTWPRLPRGKPRDGGV